MAKQQIIWTGLPNGVTDDGKLKLSIVVSPRLETGDAIGSLEAFPDFWDWPLTLREVFSKDAIALSHFYGKASIPLEYVPQVDMDSGIWKSFFDRYTRVCPYVYQSFADRNTIATFSVKGVMQGIRGIYGKETGHDFSFENDRISISQAVLEILRSDPRADIIKQDPGEVRTYGDWNRFLEFFYWPLRAFSATEKLTYEPLPYALRNLRPPAQETLPDIARYFTEINVGDGQAQRLRALTAFASAGDHLVDANVILEKWLLILGSRQTNADLRDYFFKLARRIDPKIVDVKATNPTKSRAFNLAASIGPIARQIASFYPRLKPIHRRPTEEQPDPCLLDFHKTIGSLGQYPFLMRKLGLIIDVQTKSPIRPETVRLFQDGEAKFQTAIGWHKVDRNTRHVRPFCIGNIVTADGHVTAFQLAERQDIGAGRRSSIQSGFIRCASTTDFELMQIDVDGTAFKLSQFAETLRGTTGNSAVANGEFTGLPALRTAGLGLAENGRLSKLAELSRSADSNNDRLRSDSGGDPPNPFYADDLVRGFRVDIQETRADGKWSTWRSLSTRRGTYKIQSATMNYAFPWTDEGWVSPALTTQTAENGQPIKLLHEALFKWEGWSLVVPRLDNVVIANDPSRSTASRGQIGRPEDQKVSLPLKFLSESIPGSLPRLRFGRDYRMRVRVVDLAGNSPTLESEGEPDTISAPIRFRRFEPLPSPTIILARELDLQNAPGAAGDRLVIRTLNETPDQDALRIDTVEERYVAPTQTSQNMAELHGMFDDVIGSGGPGGRANTYKMLKKLDAGTLSKTENGDMIIDPNEDLTPDGNLKLPYLPDPIVHGLSLINLPGAPPETVGEISANSVEYKRVYSDVVGYLQVSVTRIPVLKDAIWPDAQSFRLVIAEGAGEPKWNSKERKLTVFLPKAHSATIKASSWGDTTDHGLLQWYLEYLAENAPTGKTKQEAIRDVTDAMKYGLHRLVTPSREITLVHAVKQPLGFPAIEQILVRSGREQSGVEEGARVGETAVILAGEFWTHATSTAKLDLTATWAQLVDDGMSTPSRRTFRQHVLDQHIPLESDGIPTVEQDGVALRYAVDSGGNAGSSDGNAADADLVTYFNFVSENVGVKRNIRHEFGDLKYRRVRYRISATSRFKEYFSQDVRPEAFSRDSKEEFEIVIPSRARPQPPKPALIVPTFRWNRVVAGVSTRSQRICGLRIYLDRPWASSGDGEMLGIVTSTVPNEAKYESDIPIQTGRPPIVGGQVNEWTEGPRAVSHWGSDPVWVASTVWKLRTNDLLDPIVVVNARWNDKQLNTAAGANDDPNGAQVSCYDVLFDEERQQWFADVEFHNEGLYFPFIRLALVRYQPNSLPDQHLSEVALADFAQLPPDRLLTSQPAPDDEKRRELVLAGVSYTHRPMANININDGNVGLTPGPSVVRAHIERRQKRLDNDPDIDWEEIRDDSVRAITLKSSPSSGKPGEYEWWGRILIPEARPDSELRIVVQEFEAFNEVPFPGDSEYPTERVTYMETIYIG